MSPVAVRIAMTCDQSTAPQVVTNRPPVRNLAQVLIEDRCVSLATSHSRRRTKLHTRVVGSPSGTPIKVACSVLNTVGGPQSGSFTWNELPKRRAV